jgi:hypothetical protein
MPVRAAALLLRLNKNLDEKGRDREGSTPDDAREAAKVSDLSGRPCESRPKIAAIDSFMGWRSSATTRDSVVDIRRERSPVFG